VISTKRRLAANDSQTQTPDNNREATPEDMHQRVVTRKFILPKSSADAMLYSP